MKSVDTAGRLNLPEHHQDESKRTGHTRCWAKNSRMYQDLDSTKVQVRGHCKAETRETKIRSGTVCNFSIKIRGVACYLRPSPQEGNLGPLPLYSEQPSPKLLHVLSRSHDLWMLFGLTLFPWRYIWNECIPVSVWDMCRCTCQPSLEAKVTMHEQPFQSFHSLFSENGQNQCEKEFIYFQISTNMLQEFPLYLDVSTVSPAYFSLLDLFNNVSTPGAVELVAYPDQILYSRNYCSLWPVGRQFKSQNKQDKSARRIRAGKVNTITEVPFSRAVNTKLLKWSCSVTNRFNCGCT